MKYPSRDLTYEWGRTAPDELAKYADALDTKLVGLLAAASIIISVVAGLPRSIPLNWTAVPFGIAVMSFAIVFTTCMLALHSRQFRVTDSPTILKRDWWSLEPEVLKEQYWEYVEDAFKENYQAVKTKGQALQLVVPFLGIEVVALLVWLFLL